jgi:hypothetical protein
MSGVQLGGLATSTGRAEGVQIGGIATIASRSVEGAQVAGIGAYAHRMRGVQIAGISAVAERVRGAQISGIANVGGDVEGVQVGLVNVARKMRGVQVGLINLSDDGADSYPIGLINYSKNGTLAVDGWVESDRLSGAAFRHGTKHLHNVWGLAWSPDHDHMLAGAGLGIHASLGSGVGLDLDAMNWWTNVWNGEVSQLNQLRATVSIPVGGGIELIGGAAANVYITNEMDESANFHPVVARRYESDSGIHVVSWPSAFAGVRLRAR